MTQKHSMPDENGGRCESCNRPQTVGMVQTRRPIYLGPEIGWGSWYLCNDCLLWKDARDALKLGKSAIFLGGL